jgi:hypothetical protein
MAERLGEAVLDLRADRKHLRSDLAGAKRDTDQAWKDIRKGSDKAAKFAGVALLAIGAAAYKATQSASDLGESINKSQQVFGKAARTMPGYASSVADSLGLSRAAALDAAAGIGAMLVPMGLSQDAAAKMSSRMTTLAADLASLHNEDPTEMLDRLRAGLSGESEPLKRFGIVLSEVRVQQEAYRTGIAETGATLTESQKIQARYSLAIRDAGAANGDFARTSGGLANQQRILRAEVADLAASLGGVLLPAGMAVVGVLRDVAGVVDRNRTTTLVLVGVVGGLAVAVIAVNGALRAYAAYQTASAALSSIFVTRTVAQAAATEGAAVAQTGLNTAMKANTIGIVITALALVATGLVLAYKKSETFRNVVTSAVKPVNAAFEVLSQTIGGIATALGNVLGVGRDIKKFFEDLAGGSDTTAKDVATANQKIQASARRTAGTAKGAAADYVRAAKVQQEAVAGTSAVVDAFGKKADTIGDQVVRRWGSQADHLVTAMANKKEGAAAAGSQVGAAWITGVVSGVNANRGAVDAAFGGVVASGHQAAKKAVRAKSPSKDGEDLGKDYVAGVVYGVNERAPHLALAITEAVRAAVADARRNVPALAASLAGALGQAMDVATAKALAPYDPDTGAATANLRAMVAARTEGQRAQEQVGLTGAITDAATGLNAVDAEYRAALAKATTAQERADAATKRDEDRVTRQKALTDAHVALANWEADQAIAAEERRVTAERTGVETAAADRKATMEQGLTDLADQFARGEIKQKAFLRRLNAILLAAKPDMAAAGKELGTAFSEAYGDTLVALRQQVDEVAGGPKSKADPLRPTVVSPGAVQAGEWEAHRRELANTLGGLRNAAKTEGSPGDVKVTADEQKAIDKAAAALATWMQRKPLASGGILTSPTLGWLAEAGVPEAVIPLDGSPRSWALAGQALAAMPGPAPGPSGPLVNVERLVVRDQDDAQLVAARLSRYLATQGVK